MPLAWPVVVNAVVAAPSVALEVYKASLKALPLVAVKLCVPTNSSCLKLVGIAEVIAMLKLLDDFRHVFMPLAFE